MRVPLAALLGIAIPSVVRSQLLLSLMTQTVINGILATGVGFTTTWPPNASNWLTVALKSSTAKKQVIDSRSFWRAEIVRVRPSWLIGR